MIALHFEALVAIAFSLSILMAFAWMVQQRSGLMPSHHLIRQYADLLEGETEQRWSGTHYQRTARDWFGNFDANREQIEVILRNVYGNETALWMVRRWRRFFLATAGLFGYVGGSEGDNSHYRMKAGRTDRVAARRICRPKSC